MSTTPETTVTTTPETTAETTSHQQGGLISAHPPQKQQEQPGLTALYEEADNYLYQIAIAALEAKEIADTSRKEYERLKCELADLMTQDTLTVPNPCEPGKVTFYRSVHISYSYSPTVVQLTQDLKARKVGEQRDGIAIVVKERKTLTPRVSLYK